MEQKLDNQAPIDRINKDRAIWVGTYLGGPLAAGFLIAENFKAFNESDRARRTWIYAIISTLVLIGGAFLVPDNARVPNPIVPLVYTAIAYYLVRHYQEKNISTHLESGGQSHSWWRTVAVGIIGLAVTVVSIIGISLLWDNINESSIATATYGVMKHEIEYDRRNISEEELNQLADGLTKATFFDEAKTKYVYVKKVDGKYELSISVVDGVSRDNDAIQCFQDLKADLQHYFPHNRIVFKLVPDNVDNVVTTIE